MHEPYSVGDHSRLVEMFEVAEDASRDARLKAERDVDYYDGKQLTPDEVKTLKKRGQPPRVDNRIKRKIRYLQGLEQQGRTEPRALPRTPVHEQDAHSVTDALRAVCEFNNYDQVRSQVNLDLLRAGWCGTEIVAEYRDQSSNPRVIQRRCPWDRMFWDPFSSESDFKDAAYLGLVLWMDRDEALRRYGKTDPAAAGKVFDETVSMGQVGGTYDDKPKLTTWVAYDRRYRIRVVQVYYKDAGSGVWMFCEYTKGGYLTAPQPSSWLDEHGNPEHPYAWRSANVDRDNNRYGEVRDMIDLQDGINKRGSKLLHLANQRQTFGSEMALGDMAVKDLKQQLARPDGHVGLAMGVEWGKNFGIIPTDDMAQSQLLLLQQDLASLDLQGPNAAMQGKDPRSQSGRAILAQQQGGATEANPVSDQLRDMDHETYRKTWRRIRQFWKEQEWIRITDDQNNLRWVGMNAPKTMQMQLPDGSVVEQPMIDPMTGEPQLQNVPSLLDVDIIIGDAPPVGTMQQEEFAQLAEFGKVTGLVPPKVLLKASSFRSKADMLEELDKAEQAKAEQPNPEAQKMQAQLQLEQQKAQAQMQIKQAELAMQREQKAAELGMQRQEREEQLRFEAAKHAQEMQFAREKFELEQAAREQAARDAHMNAQRQESRVN